MEWTAPRYPVHHTQHTQVGMEMTAIVSATKAEMATLTQAATSMLLVLHKTPAYYNTIAYSIHHRFPVHIKLMRLLPDQPAYIHTYIHIYIKYIHI